MQLSNLLFCPLLPNIAFTFDFLFNIAARWARKSAYNHTFLSLSQGECCIVDNGCFTRKNGILFGHPENVTRRTHWEMHRRENPSQTPLQKVRTRARFCKSSSQLNVCVGLPRWLIHVGLARDETVRKVRPENLWDLSQLSVRSWWLS